MESNGIGMLSHSMEYVAYLWMVFVHSLKFQLDYKSPSVDCTLYQNTEAAMCILHLGSPMTYLNLQRQKPFIYIFHNLI